MILEVDIKALSQLVRTYNEVMVPHHSAALECAVALAVRCKERDAELVAALECSIDEIPEPERRAIDQEELWQVAKEQNVVAPFVPMRERGREG